MRKPGALFNVKHLQDAIVVAQVSLCSNFWEAFES
jgi:hypothetical protein